LSSLPLLPLVLSLANMAACDDEPAPAPPASAAQPEGEKASAEAKEAPAEPQPKPAAEPQPPVYSYDPIGKRDPFRSYLAELADKGREQTPQRRTEPTEEYELDQFRLTAIVTGTSQPRAMVEDPTERGHVLRIGSRLGKHGGRVTRISATGIVVTEETRDATGKRVRVRKRIELPQPDLDPILQ
jgi:type IV pilus assembly protein PilP